VVSKACLANSSGRKLKMRARHSFGRLQIFKVDLQLRLSGCEPSDIAAVALLASGGLHPGTRLEKRTTQI